MKKHFNPAAFIKVWLLLTLFPVTSCEKDPVPEQEDISPVSLEELAGIFSNLKLCPEHLDEVYSAVSSSLSHGYDEEYMMADLFTSPGAGVGSDEADTKASSSEWKTPLRDLLSDYLGSIFQTKSGERSFSSAEEYMKALMESDAQIYWPYSEEWDGESYPIITFNPGSDLQSNIGYQMSPDGTVKEVVVNEDKARKGNVWVMNRNEDSGYQTLEMLRLSDPDWGSGGSISIRTKGGPEGSGTKALLLKSFEARRNFDTWFAGASEFFVKVGAVEDFLASTEAEMKLYSSEVTDFMVVVKRSQVGTPIPFNVVLISEYTEQMDQFAFLITEDDGGTRTSWKTSAVVKIQSKSYGFEVELPLNSRDDIVWRGKLARSFIEKNDGQEVHFGDVYVRFALE